MSALGFSPSENLEELPCSRIQAMFVARLQQVSSELFPPKIKMCVLKYFNIFKSRTFQSQLVSLIPTQFKLSLLVHEVLKNFNTNIYHQSNSNNFVRKAINYPNAHYSVRYWVYNRIILLKHFWLYTKNLQYNVIILIQNSLN